MKSVNIATLKDQLSHYLRMVRRGERVLVRDRDRIVAVIEPASNVDPSWGSEEQRVAELEQRGVLRRNRSKLPAKFFEKLPTAKSDVVDQLISDRQQR